MSLTERESEELLYNWHFWARPEQLEPEGDWWDTWLLLAGRGFGKTRTGAETVIERVYDGRWRRVALVARTAADCRDVMVEGESGIMAYSPPWFRPHYEPSKRRLTWPNGAIATTYSGDVPALLRGPQHDGAWADELAAWRFKEAWDNLQLGLRLGKAPQCVVTTTPRPIPMIKELVAEQGKSVAVTRGSTFANMKNLSPKFIRSVVRRYQGTRLGRQELEAVLLDDNPNALWTRATLDKHRFNATMPMPQLRRICVGVDPGISDDAEKAAETGIVVAGIDHQRPDPHGYVLSDKSLVGTPLEWAREAVGAYKLHRGDRIIAEINQGGDMVTHTIHSVDRRVPVQVVRATRGKAKRAEPVAALYERGLVHHVGMFGELEDQMVQWEPNTDGQESPDRMDALVWVLTSLMVEPTDKTAHAF